MKTIYEWMFLSTLVVLGISLMFPMIEDRVRATLTDLSILMDQQTKENEYAD